MGMSDLIAKLKNGLPYKAKACFNELFLGCIKIVLK
jgi:hypothetical protein